MLAVPVFRRPARPFHPLRAAIILAPAALLGGCGDAPDPTSLQPATVSSDPGPAAVARAAAPAPSLWRAVAHLGDAVSSTFADAHPAVSANQLSLYFTAGQGLGGEGRRDIWVSRRESPTAPWGAPVNLGPVINTGSQDDNPTLSLDGRWLYFSSNRPHPDGFGGFDLWVSHRDDPDDDLGWGPPVNLGSGVNSAADERDATPVVEPAVGGRALYFTSNRAGTSDIYVARLRADGSYGDADVVEELSGPAQDESPTLSRDGREIYFASDRDGSLGLHDLWVATRAGRHAPWSPPANLGPTVNGPSNDVGPDLAVDGRTLYFASAFRPGNESEMYDLWSATRR